MTGICVRAWVYGRVQGVGFRYSTRTQALKDRLQGYANNLDDGSVEVLICGDSEGVERLLAWLKAGGPASARVDKVVTEPCRPPPLPRDFTTG